MLSYIRAFFYQRRYPLAPKKGRPFFDSKGNPKQNLPPIQTYQKILSPLFSMITMNKSVIVFGYAVLLLVRGDVFQFRMREPFQGLDIWEGGGSLGFTPGWVGARRWSWSKEQTSGC